MFRSIQKWLADHKNQPELHNISVSDSDQDWRELSIFTKEILANLPPEDPEDTKIIEN